MNTNHEMDTKVNVRMDISLMISFCACLAAVVAIIIAAPGDREFSDMQVLWSFIAAIALFVPLYMIQKAIIELRNDLICVQGELMLDGSTQMKAQGKRLNDMLHHGLRQNPGLVQKPGTFRD